MDNKTTTNRIIKCLIVWFFGVFGAHKFIEHKYVMGIMYVLTGGIFGMGYLLDVVLSIINIFSPLKYFESAYQVDEVVDEPIIQDVYEDLNDYHEAPVQNTSYDDFNYINAKDLDVPLNAAQGYPDSYVVLDTSNTGIDASTCHIIEISVIKYVNGVKDSSFSTLINPGEVLKASIVNQTGITDKELMGAPSIEEVLPDLFVFIGDYTIVGHNIGFDIRMLRAECLRNNLMMIENPVIDTISLARRLWDLDSYRIDTIRHYLGMSVKDTKTNSDCDVANRIYQIFKENRA